jgi:hypothetical protein
MIAVDEQRLDHAVTRRRYRGRGPRVGMTSGHVEHTIGHACERDRVQGRQMSRRRSGSWSWEQRDEDEDEEAEGVTGAADMPCGRTTSPTYRPRRKTARKGTARLMWR